MAISYLKKTYKDVVIKVAGNNIIETIELSDLIAQTEYFDDNPLIVNIIGVSWTGHYNTTITISRNNKIILSLPSAGSNYIDFCMDNLTREDTDNTSNIIVNISGGQG